MEALKKTMLFIFFLFILLLLLWLVWHYALKMISGAALGGASNPILKEQKSLNSYYYFGASRAPKVSVQDLGEFSPLKGKLSIFVKNSPSRNESLNEEYLVLSASKLNTAPVKISGLIIQSLVSGKAGMIPKGVKTFKIGKVNKVEDIYLKPGEEAFIYSGKSPVLLSFKENMCTGYLNALRKFEPPLSQNCPLPEKLIPNTLENLKELGDACMDAVASLNKCEYFTPSSRHFAKSSAKCKERLGKLFNYNACVENFSSKNNFYGKDSRWRIYLSLNEILWKDRYEVIRLLDEDGKTVDYTSY